MRFFTFDLLELVLFDKLYFFKNESDNDGSGSHVTFTFLFSSGKSVGSAGISVGSVNDVGAGDFVRIEIETVGDCFPLFVIVSRGA